MTSSAIYRKAMILFLTTYLVLAAFTAYAILVSPKGELFDLTPLTPFENQYYDGLAIFLTYPLVTIIGALVGSYLVAPLYLQIHKTLFSRMTYGIQQEPQPVVFRQTFRGWYPTLLAFHLNSILLLAAPDMTGQILGTMDVDPVIRYGAGNLVLMIITLGAGYMVFSAAWNLIDAGIMYSTKQHVEGTGLPSEGRTVGGWFHDYLRGYAGFGVALSYVWLLVRYYNEKVAANKTTNIVEIVFMFATPLFITLATIPAPVILDNMRAHRIRHLRGIASRKGINRVIRVSFEEMPDHLHNSTLQ